MVRGDLAAADIGVLEHQFPGLGARLDSTGQAGPDAASHRVQPSHPDPRSGEPVDNPDDWVQQLHPAPGTGCNQRTTGVQPAQLRGAAVAPEPYKEPSRNRAAAARETPPAARGGSAAEYFAALGDRWQLTGRQRARLIPAVTAALDAGWMPHALAAFTGAEHHRGTEPLRGARRAALTRRAAPATSAACEPPAVVRRVRPGHPDARVRRRLTEPVPALQTAGHPTARLEPREPIRATPTRFAGVATIRRRLSIGWQGGRQDRIGPLAAARKTPGPSREVISRRSALAASSLPNRNGWQSRFSSLGAACRTFNSG